MDFNKRLAAFVSCVEGSGGIALWKPWELGDVWQLLERTDNEQQLLEYLSDPQRDRYQAWLKQWGPAAKKEEV